MDPSVSEADSATRVPVLVMAYGPVSSPKRALWMFPTMLMFVGAARAFIVATRMFV